MKVALCMDNCRLERIRRLMWRLWRTCRVLTALQSALVYGFVYFVATVLLGLLS